MGTKLVWKIHSKGTDQIKLHSVWAWIYGLDDDIIIDLITKKASRKELSSIEVRKNCYFDEKQDKYKLQKEKKVKKDKMEKKRETMKYISITGK